MLNALMSVGALLSERMRRDDRGVTAIEYALIALVIAMVIIGAVGAVGTALNGIFTTVAGSFGG